MLDSLATTVANDNATLDNSTSVWTIQHRESNSSPPAVEARQLMTEACLVVPLICVGLVGNSLAFAALSSRGCSGWRYQWNTHRAISVLLKVLSRNLTQIVGN
jgi:hypothetical protein